MAPYTAISIPGIARAAEDRQFGLTIPLSRRSAPISTGYPI